MIRGEWRIPQKFIEKMGDIKDMISQLNNQVSHIFREANQLANFITNTPINKEEIQQFHNFTQLPSMGRKNN